ncbi:Probable indole-3-acetic acid-amido synthetase GH3.1, partial [Striga hermonthica]
GFDEGKALSFMFIKSETETRGGVPIQLALTHLYKSDAYRKRAKDLFTSPNEAILCTDLFQSTYTQMLCGLHERHRIHSVHALFASGLVRLINFLQLHWQQLTHDIRTGSLDPRVTDESIRKYMAGTYKPHPDLADSIASECSRDNWGGIIPRIWPHAKILGVIATGTMEQYIPTLDYYSGGLPIVSMVYASSESFLGINLNPICNPSEVSYTFMPFLAYFEFIPYEPNSSGQSDPVDLVNVQIGKEYEVVLTTPAGLYRYRLGDIVRVTGFYNSAPQFRFVRRKDVVLNIDWEKTKETELQEAVRNASRLLLQFDAMLLDYTSRADTTSVPGHYVVYWELLAKDSGGLPSDEVLQQCCLVMEESFNSVYRMLRESSIGPLELRVVKNGTFEEMMEHAVSRGASVSQYKVPRCVRDKEMVGRLDSRVVSKHFSTSRTATTFNLDQQRLPAPASTTAPPSPAAAAPTHHRTVGQFFRRLLDRILASFPASPYQSAHPPKRSDVRQFSFFYPSAPQPCLVESRSAPGRPLYAYIPDPQIFFNSGSGISSF